MAIKRKSLAAIAVAAIVSASLTACGGDDSTGTNTENPNSAGTAGAGEAGGTLYVKGGTRVPSYLDPQRVYTGVDISWTGRTVYRSLVQSPNTTDAAETAKVVPDLATDTGTSTADAKEWKFTLKDGVTWEDGSDITCEDLKYGISRTFANDIINGGPSYAISMLDIPKAADGSSVYKGPYKGTAQEEFDKAVTCDGKTITYRFSAPFPDFALAIANLRAFDPFKQSEDKGANSIFSVFASGPYKLDGKWDKNKGGTLVRNDAYDPATDEAGIRKALPDEIVFQYGDTDESITEQLIADSGQAQSMVAFRRIPPPYISQIVGPVAERYTNVDSPYTDYLVPNFNQMKDPLVRQALAVSTNTQAWIDAGGGEKYFSHAKSIVSPTLLGYQDNPAFANLKPEGDPEEAKRLLTEAGVDMPYPIKFTYSGGTPTSDNQASALKETWDKSGFEVTLDPLTGSYYDVINVPTSDFDVTWAGWGADWPSSKSVLQPLFDGRINITESTNGNDYGNYNSPEFNKLLDEAASLPTVEEQVAKFAEADAVLGKDTAYIPLEITKFNWLRGSKVTGYLNSQSASTYPDLAGIGVEQ